MALSQIYTAIAGDVITADRWNDEFGNIYSNGTDVAFPVTKAVSFAGFTVTLDASGVTTMLSSSSQGFQLTPGAKSGTPGINGSFLNLVAATFTDTNTAGSGTAAQWNGTTIRTPTLAASNSSVTTTDAATLKVEAGPTAGSNQTLTNSWAIYAGGPVNVAANLSTSAGDVTVTNSDARTATVDVPVTITSTTSGSPAAGIGTGILVRAESADENPSDFGQMEFAATDVGTGTEDTYFQVLLRVAGAALTACYRWAATGAFKGIFTHANTADRTYTLPNYSVPFEAGKVYRGPTSTGASSTQAHEGTVTIAASQALSGIHFYTDFTLDAAQTLTAADSSHGLFIYASGTITINGIIDCIGAGDAGGAGGTGAAGNGAAGSSGFTQPGGGGGGAAAAGGNGAAGGGVYKHSVLRQAGAAGGASGANGSVGTSVTATSVLLDLFFAMMGGASGGGGGANGAGTEAGAAGGRGGGSIILCAPTIVLGAASTLNTSGGAGTATSTDGGAGGGGGAGNILLVCTSLTDGGCTFTMTGGAGGVGSGGGFDGGAGANGVRQINIYA